MDTTLSNLAHPGSHMPLKLPPKRGPVLTDISDASPASRPSFEPPFDRSCEVAPGSWPHISCGKYATPGLASRLARLSALALSKVRVSPYSRSSSLTWSLGTPAFCQACLATAKVGLGGGIALASLKCFTNTFGRTPFVGDTRFFQALMSIFLFTDGMYFATWLWKSKHAAVVVRSFQKYPTSVAGSWGTSTMPSLKAWSTELTWSSVMFSRCSGINFAMAYSIWASTASASILVPCTAVLRTSTLDRGDTLPNTA